MLRLTSAWPYAMVPAVVFVLLESTYIALAWNFIKPWATSHVVGDAWYQDALRSLTAIVAVAVPAALGWIFAMFLTPPLCAPALERIVAIVERSEQAPARVPLSFVAELWCGIRATLVSSAITLPLILGLTLLELVAPPAAIVATPLKLLLGALGVAWGLFDYPLTLRGVGVRERFALVRRHASVVLGFGAAFALLFWLPCCSIVMLPVGVVAATRLVLQIERALPAAPQ